MSKLYYLFWAIRILAGFFVDLYDIIMHRRDS